MEKRSMTATLSGPKRPLADLSTVDVNEVLNRILREEGKDVTPLDVAAFNSSI